MEEKVRLRRSILWATGSKREESLAKGIEYGADAIRLDLEDLVPPERKEAAREEAIEFLNTADFGGLERMVRVNHAFSRWGADDLRRIPHGRPDCVTLAKVSGPEEIRRADEWLAEGEQEAGLEVGSIELMPLLETAFSVLNAQEIMSASPRIKAFNFGIQDLATDLGATPTASGQELIYAQQHALLVGRALGLMPIQGTTGLAGNLDDFEASTRFAKEMGYEGRSCIHPDQVKIANRIFTPSPEEIAEARRWIDEYEAQRATGSLYAFDDKGVIIGPPVLKRYKRTLAIAEAAGAS